MDHGIFPQREQEPVMYGSVLHVANLHCSWVSAVTTFTNWSMLSNVKSLRLSLVCHNTAHVWYRY